MYTAANAFFDALIDAGITHCFVNLGSDHPALLEAMIAGQTTPNFPRIITCPSEMVALSMADGYARVSGRVQCVIVHTDVGTQALGAAIHNASTGRCPVLIFAGMSPSTCFGELPGSRTEWIHWLQDIPDQKAIVGQYCRYTAEIKRGVSVRQMVGRAVQVAASESRGPVYLCATREALEEEIERVGSINEHWGPIEPAALPENGVTSIAKALLEAKNPLLITGYSGRNHAAVQALVDLADTIKTLRVLETGGSDLCLPSNHPAYLGLRYGKHTAIPAADAILVLDCDVPWIPTQCAPAPTATIFHIDSDPLKNLMPLFHIPACARYRADAFTALSQLVAHVRSQAVEQSDAEEKRREEEHKARAEGIEQRLGEGEGFGTGWLCKMVRRVVPQDAVFVVEAVTNTFAVADNIGAVLPGSWINCGGGGLGWSGGAALGIKLALEHEATPKKGKFVVQIVGDGTFLFSVPSSVYWISQRYHIPILTIVLNNNGWNAPRQSLLLVHPSGPASRASNTELNIAISDPVPDYGGIARAASGGAVWSEKVAKRADLENVLRRAVEAVEGGVAAVVDASVVLGC